MARDTEMLRKTITFPPVFDPGRFDRRKSSDQRECIARMVWHPAV
jgi:hypothetical protein